MGSHPFYSPDRENGFWAIVILDMIVIPKFTFFEIFLKLIPFHAAGLDFRSGRLSRLSISYADRSRIGVLLENAGRI